MPTIPEILAEFVGTPPAPITPDADLRADLLLDNLDMIELALTLEDKLAISLDEEQVARCRTVADLERLVGHG